MKFIRFILFSFQGFSQLHVETGGVANPRSNDRRLGIRTFGDGRLTGA